MQPIAIATPALVKGEYKPMETAFVVRQIISLTCLWLRPLASPYKVSPQKTLLAKNKSSKFLTPPRVAKNKKHTLFLMGTSAAASRR